MLVNDLIVTPYFQFKHHEGNISLKSLRTTLQQLYMYKWRAYAVSTSMTWAYTSSLPLALGIRLLLHVLHTVHAGPFRLTTVSQFLMTPFCVQLKSIWFAIALSLDNLHYLLLCQRVWITMRHELLWLGSSHMNTQFVCIFSVSRPKNPHTPIPIWRARSYGIGI